MGAPPLDSDGGSAPQLRWGLRPSIEMGAEPPFQSRAEPPSQSSAEPISVDSVKEARRVDALVLVAEDGADDATPQEVQGNWAKDAAVERDGAIVTHDEHRP